MGNSWSYDKNAPKKAARGPLELEVMNVGAKYMRMGVWKYLAVNSGKEGKLAASQKYWRLFYAEQEEVKKAIQQMEKEFTK